MGRAQKYFQKTGPGESTKDHIHPIPALTERYLQVPAVCGGLEVSHKRKKWSPSSSGTHFSTLSKVTVSCNIMMPERKSYG
jgi:hypothetical protein